MPQHTCSAEGDDDSVQRQTLWSALLNRRSRRFAAGLELPDGPLAHRSRFAPVALTEEGLERSQALLAALFGKRDDG